MRAPFFPLIVSLGAAATASAQPAQTTVDIGVSVPTFSKGVVQARVGRKDPSGAKVITPDMKVRVTVAVKGDRPFYSTDVSLKSGGVQTISAPYDGAGVVFTVTANAIGVKELLPADNSRDSPPPLIATLPRPVTPSPTPAPAAAPAPAPSPPPAPAPPPPPAPAPAPAPSPPAAPPAASLTTPTLILVGGTTATPTVGAATAGATVRTPGLVLVGGAAGAAATGATGARITTPTLILIGRE